MCKNRKEILESMTRETNYKLIKTLTTHCVSYGMLPTVAEREPLLAHFCYVIGVQVMASTKLKESVTRFLKLSFGKCFRLGLEVI